MKPNRDKLIITNATTGEIITTIDLMLFRSKAVHEMINDLLDQYIDYGIMVKVGISPYCTE